MTDKPKGQLTVVVGPMRSGKTAYMLDMIRDANEAGKRIRVFKPDVDTRNEDCIRSRNGFYYPAETLRADFPAIPFNTADADEVFIDEAQFFDLSLPAIIIRLLACGINVTVSGLDLDFATKPFMTVAQLMAFQTARLVRCYALCNCGCDAEYTQRLKGSGERFMVGDSEYEPRCGICYDPPANVIHQREQAPDA